MRDIIGHVLIFLTVGSFAFMLLVAFAQMHEHHKTNKRG